MKKQFLLNLVLGVSWILAALALALRVYSLRFNPPPNAILFWLPYIVLVSVSAFISLTRHDNVPIIVTLGLALILHSINVLRQPGGINWGKDSVHNLQTATKGLATGHFVLGNPNLTGHAFDQSFYPGLELLMSYLNVVATIPLTTLYNFAFVPINLLTLLFFFFFMRMLVKNRKIINVSILLYALNPQFNGFNSSTLHESLAIIFYPLVIAALLTENVKTFRHRGMLIVIILSASLITITNEFTMYVLTSNAFVIVITYFLTEKQLNALVREKLMLLFLLVTLLFSWLSFIAVHFLETHTSLIMHIINSVSSSVDTKGVPISPSSLPFLGSFFSYLGFGLLFITSLIGIYLVGRKAGKEIIDNVKRHVLVTWWIVNLGMIILFEIIPWQKIGETPIRFRSMEFAYFGIVPFSAMGIEKITMLKVNHLMNDVKWRQITKVASLIGIVLIANPTIYVGFQPYFYDNEPQKTMSHLYSVEAYFSSAWLSQYSVSTYVAGTIDGQTFVSGYASKIFSYAAFKTSIQRREILADTYYVNLANMVPDEASFRIEMHDLLWLDSRLSRVYDNGRTIILIANDQSQTP